MSNQPHGTLIPSKKLYAQSKITHPARILFIGKSGSGKTTAAVQLFLDVLQHQVKRLIVICPSYWTQDIFRCLDPFTRDGLDVIETPNANTFLDIKMNVLQNRKSAKKKGQKPIATLLFIDDLSGENIIHGGRLGGFANLAVQLRPLGISAIVIAQQATAISPAFRDNITAVIAYPSDRKKDITLIHEEYAGDMTTAQIRSLVKFAWRGGRHDNTEWGTHFLFILVRDRTPTAYYGDYKYKITPTSKDSKKPSNL